MTTLRDEGTGRFVPTLCTGPAWRELLDGMTLSAFCLRTGVPRESLARWAKGIRPREGSIAQIALATGRSPIEIRRIFDEIAKAAERATETAGES